jgi:hypothetical protein
MEIHHCQFSGIVKCPHPALDDDYCKYHRLCAKCGINRAMDTGQYCTSCKCGYCKEAVGTHSHSKCLACDATCDQILCKAHACNLCLPFIKGNIPKTTDRHYKLHWIPYIASVDNIEGYAYGDLCPFEPKIKVCTLPNGYARSENCLVITNDDSGMCAECKLKHACRFSICFYIREPDSEFCNEHGVAGMCKACGRECKYGRSQDFDPLCNTCIGEYIECRICDEWRKRNTVYTEGFKGDSILNCCWNYTSSQSGIYRFRRTICNMLLTSVKVWQKLTRDIEESRKCQIAYAIKHFRSPFSPTSHGSEMIQELSKRRQRPDDSLIMILDKMTQLPHDLIMIIINLLPAANWDPVLWKT